MFFTDFLNYVPKIAKENLLSTMAHAKMAPLERMKALENLNYEAKNPRKAAVLMLFYPKNGITHLVLIVRNSYPGVHSSQIAFPGGKLELTDKNLEETALRETHEEIGVHPNKVEIIRSFSEIYIPPSNFLVQPFMAISTDELEFVPQPEEVKKVLEFPLATFLADETVTYINLSTSYANNIDVPAFKVEEFYVWGATAMMMSELKELILSVLQENL